MAGILLTFNEFLNSSHTKAENYRTLECFGWERTLKMFYFQPRATGGSEETIPVFHLNKSQSLERAGLHRWALIPSAAALGSVCQAWHQPCPNVPPQIPAKGTAGSGHSTALFPHGA